MNEYIKVKLEGTTSVQSVTVDFKKCWPSDTQFFPRFFCFGGFCFVLLFLNFQWEVKVKIVVKFPIIKYGQMKN